MRALAEHVERRADVRAALRGGRRLPPAGATLEGMRGAALAISCIAVFVTSNATAEPYRLPWPEGTPMRLTQDCHDRCCDDHVGNEAFAWDFANGAHFPILAAREGTVTHVKQTSTIGCAGASCVDAANYVVVDHGDGTQAVYLHLDGGSLDPSIRCGGFVRQGQRIAVSGSTGRSTGTHLHFQVSAVRDDATTMCECGARGDECGANAAQWSAFWDDARHPTKPIRFDEWDASACAGRRGELPMSINKVADEPAVALDPTANVSASADASPPALEVVVRSGGCSYSPPSNARGPWIAALFGLTLGLRRRLAQELAERVRGRF